MQDLTEYIDSLERAKGNRRAALNNYNAAREDYAEAFAPLGGVPSDKALGDLYARCQGIKGYSAGNVFVCIALLYYSPEALYGGKIPLELAKLMAQVMNVTHSSIYIARNKVCAWLGLYPDFFRAVYRIFDSLQSEQSS